MITQAALELLTQAVDGELSARDARRLRRLLDSSAPARTLFEQMQADRQRLRQLTPLPMPKAVATRLKACVADLPPFAFCTTPAKPSRRVLSRRTAWAPLAIAASLLFAVGGTSFWFVLRNAKERSRDPALVLQGPSREAGTADSPSHTTPNDSTWRNALPPETGPLPSKPIREDGERAKLPAPPAPRVPVNPAPEVAVAPRLVKPVVPDILTSPLIGPSIPFDTVQVRLPYLVALSELKDKAEAREGLLRELQRDSAFRVDLFGHNPNHELDMLRAALRNLGVTIHTEAAAHDRHKKKLPTAYVLYLECLNPVEARELLHKLAGADSPQPTRTFEMMHVAPAQIADQRELKELLGIDPGLWKRTEPGTSSKGISTGTADQVARAVASGTAGKSSEKPAVVLVHTPAVSRAKSAASKEVQHFLTRRGERKPGTVSLMIVVRGVN